MKIVPVNITNITNIQDLIRFINPFITSTTSALNNGLTFKDNIRSSFVPVTFSSIANQNLQIPHKLGATPIGYMASQVSGACAIYNGISPVFGATFVNLKCSVGGITATILFF